MRRSEFIQKLTLGFLALPLISNVKPQPGKIILYTGYIAGIGFYDLKNIYHLLSTSQALKLMREPSNKYDSNAVSVWFNGHQLGYIAKKDNQVLAKLLDGYFELHAEIVKIKKDKFMPPSGIKISISRK